MREREVENALRNMGDLKKEMQKNLKRHFFNVMDSVDDGIGERGMELEFNILPEDVEIYIRDSLFVSYVHGHVKSVYNNIAEYENMEDFWEDFWDDCVEDGVDDINDISPRTLSKIKKALGV